MALSTQKGRSFFAFNLQLSIFLLRGHVGESNTLRRRTKFIVCEKKRIISPIYLFIQTLKDLHIERRKESLSNFDMTALLM